MNRDADALLNAMLDNWRRWARWSPGRYRSLLGRLYVPSADELIDQETGEWISKPKPPSIPIDEADALKVERAILALNRRPFDAPRLLVYHYLSPGHKFAQTCRRLGVKTYAYDDTVALALAQLKRRLGL